MFRRIASVVAVAVASVASVPGAPVPREPTRPVITPANAARVKPVGEIKQDVWRIVWGPGEREVSLLGWEAPVEVLDTGTFKPVRRIASDHRPIHFATSVNRKTFAWCENTTRVELHIPGDNKPRVLETGNSQPAMVFSPDGKLLATSGYGTEVKLWDVATGRLVRSLGAGPTTGGLTVAFSPDGKLAAVGNRNAETHVYEAATGKLVSTLTRKMSHELKFSPDGRTLAVAYVDGAVALWDPATGKQLRSAATGAQEIYTIDWSPDGRVLATAGRGDKITLWASRDLKAVKELDAPEWVIQVRFSPDGTRLLSAGGTAAQSPDRKVVVWGVATGAEK